MPNGRLSEGLLGRRRHVFARGDGRLHVHVAHAGTLRLLLLGERDMRVEALTPREREILERVGRGKRNEEIGDELGISSATVAKHLEHVYEKLGVRNRTAAAALLGV